MITYLTGAKVSPKDGLRLGRSFMAAVAEAEAAAVEAAAGGAEMKILFKPYDGDVVDLKKTLVVEWRTIGVLIEKEDNRVNHVFPLPTINSVVLSKIIEYSRIHMEGNASLTDLKAWDSKFAKQNKEISSDLFMAACYLGIKSLENLIMCDKILTLRSNDGLDFTVEAGVAVELETVRRCLPEGASDVISLPSLNSATLEGVLTYCRQHKSARDTGLSEAEANEIDLNFIKHYHHIWFDLMRGASFLGVQALLNLTAETAARFDVFPPEEIVRRVLHGLYTAENERAVITELAKIN